MNMNDQQRILEQCRCFDSEGRTDESISLLTDIITHSPAGILYFERGCRLEDIGTYDLAKDDYTRAIEIEPHSKYLIARGLLFSSRLSDSQSGLQDFQQAITIDPDNPSVHINMALCNLLVGRQLEAIENARLAVKLAPKDDVAHSCLGQCLMASNRPDDAAKELEIATSLDPTSANSWSMLAHALRKSRKFVDAKVCMESAVKLDRSASYLISFAILMLDLNEPLPAIAVLEEVSRMDVTESQVYLIQGYLVVAKRMLANQ